MVALGKRQRAVSEVVANTPGFPGQSSGGHGHRHRGPANHAGGRATPSQVDAVMRDSCGFRMGPFELMDLTGIDVNFRGAQDHLRRLLPRPAHDAQPLPHEASMRRAARPQDRRPAGTPTTPRAPRSIPAPITCRRSSRRRASWSWTANNEKLVGLVMAAGAQALGADDGRSPILVAPIGKDAPPRWSSAASIPRARWRSISPRHRQAPQPS